MNIEVGYTTLRIAEAPFYKHNKSLAGAEASHVTWVNKDNSWSPCRCYQDTHELNVKFGYDVSCYLHDDLEIHEQGWLNRVLAEFEDPQVVCVGFGGAPQLGSTDLYKTAYQLPQLARFGYVSNQTDWQTHGGKLEGSKRVAVVEQFAMCMRVDWLQELGGWPVDHLTHHMLDGWVACEAARRKKKIMAVGINCTHHGGGTSVTEAYAKASWLQGGSMEEDHRRPHRWIFDSYKDVLPICV